MSLRCGAAGGKVWVYWGLVFYLALAIGAQPYWLNYSVIEGYLKTAMRPRNTTGAFRERDRAGTGREAIDRVSLTSFLPTRP
ncbi:hypothetical protein BN874_2590007 [Candidatus Contendobacter odensis Run_B_J11]|uniref:Uncharacterized protein n=1 Tax=Candidatus Contendobacter odensis Run_B_J11 TaxID=1400861 RepID=A0A7U7GCE5_9GAMM|nr:hypothetical protein BN874_2590007 [Candidatus Contendobacter odensis Run_B_J11]